jgi:hypothetical protein
LKNVKQKEIENQKVELPVFDIIEEARFVRLKEP